MIRGVIGTLGGLGVLGVFTRIGYKLYPWAGPERLEWTGDHPQRGVRMPERFSLHQVAFDRWEDMADATHHLHAGKVATFMSRTPPSGIAATLSPANRHHFEAHANHRLSEAATPLLFSRPSGASHSVAHPRGRSAHDVKAPDFSCATA